MIFARLESGLAIPVKLSVYTSMGDSPKPNQVVLGIQKYKSIEWPKCNCSNNFRALILYNAL